MCGEREGFDGNDHERVERKKERKRERERDVNWLSREKTRSRLKRRKEKRGDVPI